MVRSSTFLLSSSVLEVVVNIACNVALINMERKEWVGIKMIDFSPLLTSPQKLGRSQCGTEDKHILCKADMKNFKQCKVYLYYRFCSHIPTRYSQQTQALRAHILIIIASPNLNFLSPKPPKQVLRPNFPKPVTSRGVFAIILCKGCWMAEFHNFKF